MVPETFDELEKLPGVGHKTASVVICTAFGSVFVHGDIKEAMLACFSVSTHMPYIIPSIYPHLPAFKVTVT